METLRFVNCRPLFIAKFQGIFHLLAKSERVYRPLFEFHISSVPSSTRWINKIDTSSYCFCKRSMFTFSRFQKSNNVAPFLLPKFIFPFVHRFLVLNSFLIRIFLILICLSLLPLDILQMLYSSSLTYYIRLSFVSHFVYIFFLVFA